MQIMITILALLTMGSWLWLWFIVKRPDKWGAMVDRENAFWVRRRIVSASFAETAKRFEKGRGQKLLVGAAAVLGTLGLLAITILFLVRK